MHMEGVGRTGDTGKGCPMSLMSLMRPRVPAPSPANGNEGIEVEGEMEEGGEREEPLVLALSQRPKLVGLALLVLAFLSIPSLSCNTLCKVFTPAPDRANAVMYSSNNWLRTSFSNDNKGNRFLPLPLPPPPPNALLSPAAALWRSPGYTPPLSLSQSLSLSLFMSVLLLLLSLLLMVLLTRESCHTSITRCAGKGVGAVMKEVSRQA